MRAENRALVAAVLAVVVVSAVVGVYLLLARPLAADSLPVFAGTLFTSSDSLRWAAQFTVGPAGGTLVGGWTAYNGSGFIGLDVVNGSVSKPSVPFFCPRVFSHWAQGNGTVDLALAPGSYTAYWTTGFCASAERILVTETIQVIPD